MDRPVDDERPDKAHLFKPGQSGNPSGRPKDELGLRRLARERSAEAIDTLANIMLNPKAAAAARVSAATALLDRAYGRPVTPTAFVDLDGNDRALGVEFSALERARRIAHLLAQGVKALPAQQAQLESTNRDRDITDTAESPDQSSAYSEEL